MFDQYTPKARSIVQRAAEESERRAAASVTADHLLLALLAEPESVAISMLEHTGVSIDALRAFAETAAETASPEAPNDAGLSESAVAALDFAYEESWRRRDRHIASEHVLLGLVRLDGARDEPRLPPIGMSWDLLDRAAEMLHIEGPSTPSVYEVLKQHEGRESSNRRIDRAAE